MPADCDCAGFALNAWSNDAYLEGLARCYEQGLTQTVGVVRLLGLCAYTTFAGFVCLQYVRWRDYTFSRQPPVRGSYSLTRTKPPQRPLNPVLLHAAFASAVQLQRAARG